MRRLAPLIAALALAACGSGSEPKGTDGKSLFASSCGSCHTLQAAGTSGTFGPDLDELKPDAARVSAAIAEGPGSMPDGLLKGAQAQAVADYVAGTAGR